MWGVRRLTLSSLVRACARGEHPRMKHVATALLFTAALSARASADDGDPVFAPIAMDRFTPSTMLVVDAGYNVWDEDPGTDITTVGFTVGGHFVDPNSGFGGYLVAPLSYLSIQSTIGPIVVDDSELALGNVEAGGVLSKWLGPSTALVLHGGIALPTADDDGPGAFQANASTPRYGDLVQRWPNSTWLRLGVSPMGRAGQLFWRADVGLDLALDDDNATEISPVIRVNVGGGLDLGTAHLLAELVTNIVDDNNNPAVDESTSMLSLGVRFTSGDVQPGLALLLPLGFDQSFDLDFALAFSLAAYVGS